MYFISLLNQFGFALRASRKTTNVVPVEAGTIVRTAFTGRPPMSFPREPSTVREPAPAVMRGISPSVPATTRSSSVSAVWIPAFAGMTTPRAIPAAFSPSAKEGGNPREPRRQGKFHTTETTVRAALPGGLPTTILPGDGHHQGRHPDPSGHVAQPVARGLNAALGGASCRRRSTPLHSRRLDSAARSRQASRPRYFRVRNCARSPTRRIPVASANRPHGRR